MLDDQVKVELAKLDCLYKEQQYEEVVRICTELLKVDNKLADAYSQRSYAFRRMGKLEEAIKDVSDLIRLWPNSPRPYFTRARWYIEWGGYQEAIKDLDVVIASGEHYFLNSAHCLRSLAHLKTREIEQAFKDCALLPEEFELRVEVHEEPGKVYTKENLHQLITNVASIEKPEHETTKKKAGHKPINKD